MSDHEDRYIDYLGEHESGFLGGDPQRGLEKMRRLGIIGIDTHESDKEIAHDSESKATNTPHRAPAQTRPTSKGRRHARPATAGRARSHRPR